MTNVELIIKLMKHSKTGLLMQAFIIEAICKYSELTIANPIPENGFVNSRAWTACAQEAHEVINNHLEGPRQ